MARRFAKVLEQEIVAINEAEFSRLGIYPPLFTSSSGDTCIRH